MVSKVIVKPGRWATALQWPDGTLGWAYVSYDGMILNVEKVTGIDRVFFSTPLHDNMRLLSAAVASDGDVCCVGQGQNNGRLELYVHGKSFSLGPQDYCKGKPWVVWANDRFEIDVPTSNTEVERGYISDLGYWHSIQTFHVADGSAAAGGVVGRGLADGTPITGTQQAVLTSLADRRSLLRYVYGTGVIVGQPRFPAPYETPSGLGARLPFFQGQDVYFSIEPTRQAWTPSVAGSSERFAVATVSGAQWDEVWLAICEPPYVHEPLPVVEVPKPVDPPKPTVRPMPAFCKGLNCNGVVDGLVERGINLIRMNARPGQEMIDTIREWWRRGVEVLVIVQSVADCDGIPYNVPRVHVEIGNEPDISTDRQYTPTEYITLVKDVAAWADVRRTHYGMQDIRLWAGSVSNFSPSAFAWLDQVLPGLPPDVGITMHRYPEGGVRDLRAPRKGYTSRWAEVADLMKRMVGLRPWAISETGWHTAKQQPPGCSWFTKPFAWTNEQVAATIRAELAWWFEQEAAFCVVYQINDGPTDTPDDRYGIRRLDGAWKPQADAFR